MEKKTKTHLLLSAPKSLPRFSQNKGDIAEMLRWLDLKSPISKHLAEGLDPVMGSL